MAYTGKSLRGVLLAGSVLAGCLAFTVQPAAAQDRSYNLDLPAQSLSQALMAFGSTTDQQIVFSEGLVRGRAAPAVHGDYTAPQALALLLKDSGLVAQRNDDGVIMIQRAAQSPQGGSAEGAGAEVEALIVTAQKKEENIQDVPIAISAFSQQSLDAQKLEGGFDLLKAIPNVTFSKNNFNSYNFSIRGIGTKAISATTDPGVAVSFNNTTLMMNRLFEQEYFDVERVEVLRGPQGTLYGRNATSGVINVLSARPRMGEFSGDIELEGGNYNAQRVRGMVNVPLGEHFAVRLAGSMTKRDGYGYNEAADDPTAAQDVSSDVDNRDLWSGRVTLGWEPTESFRANLLWEHFEEDDHRVRTSKQLCHHDPGRDPVGDYFWVTNTTYAASIFKANTSQGCLPGSLYDDNAYGTPNGASLPFVSALAVGPLIGNVLTGSGVPIFGLLGLGLNRYVYDQLIGLEVSPPCPNVLAAPFTAVLNVCQPDPYGGKAQSSDIRTIYSLLEPTYRAKADIYELSFDWDITDSLTLTSQTVFNKDDYYASQDFNRFTTFPIFNDSAIACDIDAVFATGECNPGGYAGGYYNITPGGVFTDPQLGPSNTLVSQDLSQAVSEQFTQEFRLASSFEGPLNFSIGANHTDFETIIDYYIFSNTFTLLTHVYPFNTHQQSLCGSTGPDDPCIYVDPNPLESINGEGHNYFRSSNPYNLKSTGVFGEVYWQVTDALKVTAGARMTWDEKVFTPIPSQLLLWDYRRMVPEGTPPEECDDFTTAIFCQQAGTGVGGRGSPPSEPIVQEWKEPTGRLVVDWKPDLGFTDETMVYASLSHGYKGGGANPPGIAAPAGIYNAENSAVEAPPTFEPEFVDAYELGTKNVLLGGGLVVNANVFYYDYRDYQVSKIVDRAAANENFDAKIHGAEVEWVFSPTRALRFNGTFGALRTKIAEGEQSLDIMDRTQGGNVSYGGFDEWMVLKPWVTKSSNCVVPVAVVEAMLMENPAEILSLCPGGGLTASTIIVDVPELGLTYNAATDGPNGGAGFLDDVGGNELPNAPHWTASLGGQYEFSLPGGWDGTLRSDMYWQSQSYARIYNTDYDKLHAWTNLNISLWFEQPEWGFTAEVYVKNVMDQAPITDAFLGSDDTGLTTNVFTLDPRLVGVSVRKTF